MHPEWRVEGEKENRGLREGRFGGSGRGDRERWIGGVETGVLVSSETKSMTGIGASFTRTSTWP